MIIVIQYKDYNGDYVNYSVLELNDLEKVAVKLREAIDLSINQHNYDSGCIFIEFYKDGEELSVSGKWAHKFVHTALEIIVAVLEKHP